ncbi:MAG: GldM family protein [Bacteroidales bacterium]|nr:GldM family protein [Bacteroidales bacterium]
MKSLKKIHIVLTSVLFSNYLLGQVVVSVDLNNYVYAKVENPISIAVPGVLNKNLYVVAETGVLKDMDNGNYFLIPEFPIANLNIFEINESDTVLVGNYQLRVFRIPQPEVFLAATGSPENNSVSKGAFRASPYLRFKYNDQVEPLIKNIPKLISFKVSYEKDDELIETIIQGNKISNEIVQEMINQPEGTEFLVSEVKIVTSYSEKEGQVISSTHKFILK